MGTGAKRTWAPSLGHYDGDSSSRTGRLLTCQSFIYYGAVEHLARIGPDKLYGSFGGWWT